MSETPFFFRDGEHELFGVFHGPTGRDQRIGFVFVHPLLEEKLWTHRVYVSFARELSARGYPVLRFDVMGHGDSSGSFEDANVDSQLSNIRCALCTLKQRAPAIDGFGLLGLRFGGTLAAVAAEEARGMQKLILWDPVVDCVRHLREMLMINLTTQTAVYKKIQNTRDDLIKMMKDGRTVNVDGYEMSYSMYDQASSINLLGTNREFAGDCLIVQIGRKAEVFRKDLEKLRDSYPRGEIRLALEEPFWKEIKTFYGKAENLFGTTLDWLEAGK